MEEFDRREGVIIQGLDILDIMRVVDKKKNKFVALTLQAVEELDLEDEDFKTIRKYILDGFGDFTRSLMRALLGDIEFPPYNG